MQIRFEDEWLDVLHKACRGHDLSMKELALRSRTTEAALKSLFDGHWEAATIRLVAPVLELAGEALVALGEAKSPPPEIELDGLLQFNAPHPVPGYEEMAVNAYLLEDTESGKAILFDLPRELEPVLQQIEDRELALTAVLLTHSHSDHVAGMGKFRQAFPHVPVWLNRAEAATGVETFSAGKTWDAGSIQIESRLTPGHSPGGTTFVVRGMAQPLAVVGDALFASSQGGVPASAYREAIAANRKEIFSLPPETILAPGHGPMTTIKRERELNPFYAEF